MHPIDACSCWVCHARDCADVSTSCLEISDVYILITCAAQASREKMSQIRTTHAHTISPIWSRRVSFFFYGCYGRFSKDVCGCQWTHTTEMHRKGTTQRQTDRHTFWMQTLHSASMLLNTSSPSPESRFQPLPPCLSLLPSSNRQVAKLGLKQSSKSSAITL
jgi:hypothetical protein